MSSSRDPESSNDTSGESARLTGRTSDSSSSSELDHSKPTSHLTRMNFVRSETRPNLRSQLATSFTNPESEPLFLTHPYRCRRQDKDSHLSCCTDLATTRKSPDRNALLRTGNWIIWVSVRERSTWSTTHVLPVIVERKGDLALLPG